MCNLLNYVGKQVDCDISGTNPISGILVDAGPDIIVIYQKGQFYYIPLVHLQHLKLRPETDEQMHDPSNAPFDLQAKTISYRKILDQARGHFVQIYVTGDKAVHGYLTSIMNDYFIFYSPVYRTMMVSLNHLKWLIPYPLSLTPYSLNNNTFPLNPSPIPLSRTFEQQCKRYEGNLVVFDLADHPNKIGLLQHVDNNMVKLIVANGEKVFWNMHHLKTINIP